MVYPCTTAHDDRMICSRYTGLLISDDSAIARPDAGVSGLKSPLL